MSNRVVTYMTAFVIIAIMILFAINSFPLFQTAGKEPFLIRDIVKGIELIHEGKPYTLNFEQQNGLVTLINLAEPIQDPKDNPKKTPLDFEKIIIYQFNKPNIELNPIGYVNDELVFSAPSWDKDHLLKDKSHGELKQLLSKTYDH
jgi:hypothetical protein